MCSSSIFMPSINPTHEQNARSRRSSNSSSDDWPPAPTWMFGSWTGCAPVQCCMQSSCDTLAMPAISMSLRLDSVFLKRKIRLIFIKIFFLATIHSQLYIPWCSSEFLHEHISVHRCSWWFDTECSHSTQYAREASEFDDRWQHVNARWNYILLRGCIYDKRQMWSNESPGRIKNNFKSHVTSMHVC